MTSQAEFQRQTYDSHYPKRVSAVRDQLAHPLFRSFYDRLANRVLDAGPAVSAESGPTRIIDIGCGEGLLAAGFARVAAQRGRELAYTGADLSSEALDLAREHVDGRWIVGEAEAVLAEEPAASQDVLVAKNLLHHVDDPTALLSQAARVVGPEGTVVVVEARLGCPQFWVFSAFAPRREKFFFSGRRRNLRAIKAAGLEVVHTGRFSWLPYELFFAIRYRVFRRLFGTANKARIEAISRLDDKLTASPLGVLASYVVWVTRPSAGSKSKSAGSKSK